ncbi:arylamine N-acetyltransferase [Paraglaciecola sp. 2405UD69-4]|uniref:arylamine N-acetyltransferase n=1 Tax=Paraglaciecola sp. 2405UD69-4 TaxID=3391836 RepID=UPI0039C935C0
MIDKIERLILEHFCTVPFHNLNLLYGSSQIIAIPGGTCSDKTLAFLSDLRMMGVKAFLHTANIGGKEIHRLVRININNQTYFADVGNGWPTLRLLPCNENTQFECYGMKYRTEIAKNWILVFHERQGKESLQLEINITPRPEQEIYSQIKSRYSSGVNYPFSRSLRFSMIVGKEFLFLRGNRLERYSFNDFSVEKLKKATIPKIIKKEFGFNVNSYVDFKHELNGYVGNIGN